MIRARIEANPAGYRAGLPLIDLVRERIGHRPRRCALRDGFVEQQFAR